MTHDLEPEIIFPPGAAPPNGAYSPALRIGDWLFISAQAPKDPITNQIIESKAIEDHVCRVMENIKILIEAAGGTMDDIVKMTVGLKDIADFRRFDAVYGTYFKTARPARTTMEISNFADSRLIQIDAVAYLKTGRA